MDPGFILNSIWKISPAKIKKKKVCRWIARSEMKTSVPSPEDMDIRF